MFQRAQTKPSSLRSIRSPGRVPVLEEATQAALDGGSTFVRMNDFKNQYGYSNVISGDSRVFGRIYIGTAGRGIIEGNSSDE